MKSIKTDIDVNYITANNRKFANNHEVKAAAVDQIVKRENIRTALRIALAKKLSSK